jgi:hypothetical protein
VQIKPGHGGNAVYDPARDGQLQPAAAGTPANIFRNWAMLPGWQKWKPTYRYGVITALDEEADTCAVPLDDAHSSQQGLGIKQTASLADVLVSYTAVFEVGDHDLLKFKGNDWNSPVVIGFHDNPKPCSWALRVKINSAVPQQYFRIRLFHPDYGYGWCCRHPGSRHPRELHRRGRQPGARRHGRDRKLLYRDRTPQLA